LNFARRDAGVKGVEGGEGSESVEGVESVCVSALFLFILRPSAFILVPQSR
jgi:hypothetical protein